MHLFRASMDPGAIHPRRTVYGLNRINSDLMELPLNIFPKQKLDFLP